MSRFFTSILALSAAIAGVSASPLVDRATVGDSFSLFAYGSNSDTTIGGFPIYYANGSAYIVDPSKINVTSSYVVFTKDTTDSTTWLANPKVGGDAFTNVTYYVPNPSGPTGFVTSNTTATDIITSGFTFYGTLAMLKLDSKLYTLWYAVPTGIDGVWSVGWNATSDQTDAELLTVKAVNPPNVPFTKRDAGLRLML